MSGTPTLICTGQSATLSVSGASSYSWNTGSSASSITVSPLITSSYTVTGTGSNGCSNQAVYTQQVSLCTGLESNALSNNNEVYPNPFTTSLHLVLERDASVTLRNVIGQEVYTTLSPAGSSVIDTSDLPSGVYYLEIRHERSQVLKVVKP